MASALFLDPRFRRLIIQDDLKKRTALNTLKNIWRRLQTLEKAKHGISAVEESINTSGGSAGSNISFEFDENAELAKYLLIGAAQQNEIANTHEPIDIEFSLDTFDPPAMPSDQNILQFWQDCRREHEELYNLAMVVMAVPPTEVQVERDFSKLNHVFTDRRCRLLEERLEDIMLIHLNAELFYRVKTDLILFGYLKII